MPTRNRIRAVACASSDRRRTSPRKRQKTPRRSGRWLAGGRSTAKATSSCGLTTGPAAALMGARTWGRCRCHRTGPRGCGTGCSSGEGSGTSAATTPGTPAPAWRFSRPSIPRRSKRCSGTAASPSRSTSTATQSTSACRRCGRAMAAALFPLAGVNEGVRRAVSRVPELGNGGRRAFYK